MKVLIATPAYGALVNTDYHESVLKTVLFFKDEFPNIRFETATISLSMLALVRNIFASRVLNDPSFTHLLFIDSDMGFSPSLIAKMIAIQKPVVGIVAPKRKFDLEALQKSVLRSGATENDPVQVRINGAAYVGSEGDLLLTPAGNGALSLDIKGGFVQAKRVGTGILLIERTVFEILKERFPDEWIDDVDPTVRGMGLPTGGLIQCFDPIKAAHGLYNGEDMAFCQRWVDVCGGEIWANVDEMVVHVGYERYVGRYIEKLNLMAEELRSGSTSRDAQHISMQDAQHVPMQSAAPRLNRHERRAMARRAS